MTPDHSALIERLEAMGRSHRAHESGLRKRLAADDRSLSVQDPDNAARSAETCEKSAAALRDQQDRHEGMEEDLYQAVLVAYRRGAVEWTRLNYPQWFDAISAGREVCPLPSAPNQAKEAGE